MTPVKKLFSIIIPVYKSELNLPVTVPYIVEQSPKLFPNYRVELILVNDGSPDNSWELMKGFQERYPETVHVASLVHNFGQVMAIRCGISMAQGDVIGVISADLQDPFHLFVDMLAALEEGYELVCGVRGGRQEHGLNAVFSKVTHKLIHSFITTEYPVGGFDFFAFNKTVAQRISHIQEKNGSFQLLFLWVSKSVKFIPYVRQERTLGKSSWTFPKKVTYFIDTFVTNTYLPLRVMSVTGLLFALIAFLGVAYIVIITIAFGRGVPGWSSLALLITFFAGLILAALGIIGEYLWRIYDAVNGRPLYIVRKK